MPFAGYSDFDDCVRKVMANKGLGKERASAYCAEIKRKTEKDVSWSYGLTVEKLAGDADGNIYVAGFASNPDEDEDGEVMDMTALKSAFDDYMKNPVVKFMHDKAPQWKGGIGKVINKYIDVNGETHETSFGQKPYLVIKLSKGLPTWMVEVIKDGTYKGLSIGGRLAKKVQNRLLVKSWLETSIVDVPSAKGSFFNVLKAAGTFEEEEAGNDTFESEEKLKTALSELEIYIFKHTTSDSVSTINRWVQKAEETAEDKQADRKKKIDEENML